MLRFLLKICCILYIVAAFLISCGEDAEEKTESHEGQISQLLREQLRINQLLEERWKKGYVNKDIELFISSLWEAGYLHTLDNGTKDDISDDLEITDIETERERTEEIFQKFDDIKVEISEPPEIEFLSEREAKVTNNYYIQFRMPDKSTEFGYIAYYAEGKNVFIIERRGDECRIKGRDGECRVRGENDEWRIKEWKDEARSPDEIINSVF